MSKNFMSNDNATAVLTEYAEAIKGKASDSNFTPITGSPGSYTDGTAGLVPGPTGTPANRVLGEDGTWQTVGTVTEVGAEGGIITDQTNNADITQTGKVKLNLKSNTAFATEVGAQTVATDNMYPVALDSEGHPVAAVPTASTIGKGVVGIKTSVGAASSASETDVPTEKAVAEAIAALPEPMVWSGSITLTADASDPTKCSLTVSTSGTIGRGYTYKVTSIATTTPAYAGTIKVGDTFYADKKNPKLTADWVLDTDWTIVPSGDEPSGTVTAVSVNGQQYDPNAGGVVSLPNYPVNTDTYVSSAQFTDNTSSDANNPLKMTLGRSGTQTTGVDGKLPKVSSTTAGVAPKGASVSTQSQSTKFLREDGTWAVPSYTPVDNALSDSSTNPVQNKVINTALAGKQATLSSSQLAAVNSGIDSTKVAQISTNQTNILSTQDMICDTEFSTSTAYAVGDYVTYENSLYKFTSAHSAGAWNSAEVTEVNVVGIIGNINSVLEGVL